LATEINLVAARPESVAATPDVRLRTSPPRQRTTY